MSIEIVIFMLRLLAGLSLAGFLVALFIIIWRNLNQIERQSVVADTAHGFLVCEEPQLGNQFERWSLRPIITLGRASSNSIIVRDDFASANHARIVVEQGKWWLEDLQSRNGTKLNGESINRRTILADDDEIGIGNYRFRLNLNPEQAKHERSAGSRQ